MRQTILFARTAYGSYEQTNAQANKLEHFAKEHGYSNLHTFVEPRSSGLGNKNESLFLRHEIIPLIKSNEVDRIIVTRIDRISRNINKYLEFAKLCKEHNTELICTEGGNLDATLNKCILDILTIMASHNEVRHV